MKIQPILCPQKDKEIFWETGEKPGGHPFGPLFEIYFPRFKVEFVKHLGDVAN